MKAAEKAERNAAGIISRQRTIEIAKELFRKSIHICSGLMPFLFSLAKWPFVGILLLALVLYSVSEILRLKGIRIPLISQITEAAARKRDEDRFVLGPVTLVAGILLAEIIWKQEPAAAGIYALAFGDGLASISGKLFGKVKIPLTQGKTAAGSLTCFTAIFISCFLTTGNCFVALVAAAAGMFIEVLPLKDFDNLIIPVLIGGIVQFLL